MELISKRLDPKVRKEEILAVAVAHASVVGLNGLRRDDIAQKAGVANGLVSRYFNTMLQLRRAVIRSAVHNEILPIIAQGLAMREPEAMKAPEALKQKALATLSA
jgi:AcrR family transcriptional regulator